MFDNRSICRESDFPSAQTLIDAGIRRVVVIGGDRLDVDVTAVLIKWQSAGITMWRHVIDSEEEVRPVVIRKRSWYERLAAFSEELAFVLRPDGSWGARVPTSQGPHGG